MLTTGDRKSQTTRSKRAGCQQRLQPGAVLGRPVLGHRVGQPVSEVTRSVERRSESVPFGDVAPRHRVKSSQTSSMPCAVAAGVDGIAKRDT